MLSDTQAQLVSQQTSVNLIVDGKVVRSATGSNSETWTGPPSTCAPTPASRRRSRSST
ncbi:hypothetical protein ACFQ51_43940 [Streptomyces kaempferi]